MPQSIKICPYENETSYSTDLCGLWCQIQSYQDQLNGVSDGLLYCQLWNELNSIISTLASSSTVAPTPTPTYTLNCEYETYPNSSALCNLYCQILAYQGGICLDETECPYKLQVSEDLLCDLWDEIKLANTSSLGSTQSLDYSALIGSASGTNGAVAYSDCPHINDPNSFTACSLWCDLREAAMGQICTDSPICPYENFTSPLNEELCKLWLELQGLTTNPSSPTSPSSTPTADL